MKRIEAMQPEETIDFIFGCQNRVCTDCPAEKYHFASVPACIAKYLNEDVRMAARWETIKSDEDLKTMRDDFANICDSENDCEKCSRYLQKREGGIDGLTSDCFARYLLEKVPYIIADKGDERK